MKKKLIFLAILLAFLFIIYQGQSAKDVPISTIEKKITSTVKLSNMKKCDTKDMVRYIHLTPAKCKNAIYYKGTGALSVDEFIIIKCNNQQEVSALRDLIDKRIESQKKIFDGYGPAQVKALSVAIIYKKGNYIFYSVGNNGEKLKEVFKDAI